MALIKNKPVFGWVMYDWANSAFATTVMAGFFPVFFKSYWSAGADVNQSTAMLGYANSLASLIVALMAPILGAIADQSNARKRMLVVFGYFGALVTACLFMVDYGHWLLAAILYALGTIGFSGSICFYDSLLPTVANEKTIDYVSAKGYAAGYLGGGLLFLINVLWYLMPATFGFSTEKVGWIDAPLLAGSSEIRLAKPVDFSIPAKDSVGQAIVTSEWRTPFAILFYDTLHNRVELRLAKAINLTENFIDSSVAFGQYRYGKIISYTPDSQKLVIGNLTRTLTENDTLVIHLRNPITYRGYRGGIFTGVQGLQGHYANIKIKSDYLKPAREYLPIRLSFLSVGLWWIIFTIPLIKYVREQPAIAADERPNYVWLGFRQLGQTFRKIRHMRVVLLFLMAYWLYIDGVDTIIKMAVDYGMSIGLPSSALIVALLITQFVGFPAAMVFGKLGERWDAKKAIYITLAVYVGVTFWGMLMESVAEFYILAIIIGLVQGGIQALSRSYYARLIPHNQSAEFYGFFNMVGKFAAILGPALIGSVGLLVRRWGYTPNTASRAGIASVALLFIVGALLLFFVDEKKGKTERIYLERLVS